MESLTAADIQAIAQKLHDYATYFSERDWNYTRDLGHLKAIRYDYPGDSFRFRARSSWAALKRRPGWFSLRLAWHMLAREKNLPDGILNNGNIITHWEEDGEYLQFVQPTVGALVAEWLMAEPANEWAQRIAAEMIRIQRAYAARLDREKTLEDHPD